jgi:uncharacterized protein with ATP-grasp and redox domains
MPCFVNQALRALNSVDESLHEELLRDTLKTLSQIDFSKSPPEMARKIFDIIEKRTGLVDFYAEIKKQSNLYIMNIYDELRQTVMGSGDPFAAALKLAVAGNIIDFGAKHDFSDEIIHEEIEKALKNSFKQEEVEGLREKINSASDILYLGDNAGEIVFDKLFIEQLPKEKITFAVRGRPVINDALLQDAESVGLTELVKVVSNGAGIPGTVLGECSEEFRNIFDNADLIISKGQGNYETLSTSGRNIVFMLKVKCPIVSRDLGREIGDFVILQNQR